MNIVTKFIDEHKFNMLQFQSRYGDVFFISIGHNFRLMQKMDDWLNGADNEGLEMQSYLANKGAWLLCGYGYTYEKALNMIEDKILKYGENIKWINAQYEFYDWFTNFSNLKYGVELERESQKTFSPLLFESYNSDGSFDYDNYL